jgi:hypothetical protein
MIPCRLIPHVVYEFSFATSQSVTKPALNGFIMDWEIIQKRYAMLWEGVEILWARV